MDLLNAILVFIMACAFVASLYYAIETVRSLIDCLTTPQSAGRGDEAETRKFTGSPYDAEAIEPGHRG